MFLIVWEYAVKSGQEAKFERIYGANGLWVELFTKAEGFHNTELLRDTKQDRCYLTIDRWVSEAAYQSFLKKYQQEYQCIDAQCAQLTEREAALGQFMQVDED